VHTARSYTRAPRVVTPTACHRIVALVVRASVTRGCTACIRSPPPRTTPRITTPRRASYPLDDDSRDLRDLACARRPTHDGGGFDAKKTETATTNRATTSSSLPAARGLCSSTRRRLGALNKWENRRCRLPRLGLALPSAARSSPRRRAACTRDSYLFAAANTPSKLLVAFSF